MKNYYEILEVSQKASIEVIEKAYKALVKKYHPDGTKNKEITEEKIKSINEAYAVLSNEFLREQYDREIKNINNQNNYIINENKDMNDNDITKEKREKYKVTGSFEGIVGIMKNIYSNKPNLKKVKELTKNDYMSIILTVIFMIFLLIILWAIPFTRPFITSIIDIF